ncbi:hypothetical protein [Nonomuraea typhae]|uniref:Uncharacterized protein n=1 Tax=Nonomuraea typhae TaxID=2603600 RepID=A0ABW7YS35_9ACTN
MNHAERVQELRQKLAQASPQVAAALRAHELEQARRRAHRARLEDPGRWKRADAAADEALEYAALARTGRSLQRPLGSDEQEPAEVRQRLESLARARARARRERAERD